MGLFDFVESVAKIAIRTAILPVAVVKDVVTLGGIITDEECATLNNISTSTKEIINLPNKIDE